MIKHLTIAHCITFALTLTAQEYTPWESYYIPENRTERDTFNFDEHHSIYPAIKKNLMEFKMGII
jgi:hypothetical protein